jgi:HAD superfamily hydrolase (TIGR01662 family)
MINKGDLYWIDPNFNPQNNWGVFLDRDGVVIEEVNLLHKLEDYKIIPESIEAIKLLNDNHIPVILATNQTVVARGMADEDFIQSTHQLLQRDLNAGNAHLDAILACLHSPFADVERYRLDCSWRKPNSGMFTFAASKMNLDLSNCFGIGDKARDIKAYENCGMQAILVKTGHAGEDSQHEYEAKTIKNNILDAVQFILEKKEIIK